MSDQDEDELRTLVLSVSTAAALSILGVLTAVTFSMIKPLCPGFPFAMDVGWGGVGHRQAFRVVWGVSAFSSKIAASEATATTQTPIGNDEGRPFESHPWKIFKYLRGLANRLHETALSLVPSGLNSLWHS